MSRSARRRPRVAGHPPRAALALALAGRGDDVPASARERAATVWDVLPAVYASELGGDDDFAMPVVGGGGSSARGAATTRSQRARELDTVHVDGRPGLGVLSAR